VELTPMQGKLRAALYEVGAIQSEEWLDNGNSSLNLHLPDSDWMRLKQQHGI
jgi:GTP-binding protein HflX